MGLRLTPLGEPKCKEILMKSIHFEGQAGRGKIWNPALEGLRLTPIGEPKCKDFLGKMKEFGGPESWGPIKCW